MFDTPLRFATSTCESVSSSTTHCVYEYVPEVYFHDWLTVSLFVLFLLSVPVVGFYLNQAHKN
jgi:hypothetical protein